MSCSRKGSTFRRRRDWRWAQLPSGLGNVFGQGADIGSLGAMHPEFQQRRLPAQQLQAVDGDRPGFPLYLLARPGQFVERLTLVLECRVHRWYLFDLTSERLENGC